MANNYLEFSEIIENLTPEEMNWWENDAEKVGNEDDDTVCYDFRVERDKQTVWFHSDECGDVEALAMVVHEFLGKFRVNDCFSLEWASWCSKPRIGEFGGGAIFVTAREIKFHNSGQWVLERQNKWNKDYVVNARDNPTKKSWVICRDDNAIMKDNLYWSPKDGWGGIERVRIYNSDERSHFDLPHKGIWKTWP